LNGNGRIGRLWQTVILLEVYPVFEYLPFETLISQSQNDYYALSKSDKAGSSTLFIEYMLKVINDSLADLLNFKNRTLSDIDRLKYFISLDGNNFKDISSATVSRDLKKGGELGFITKLGDKRNTSYQVNIFE